MAPPLDLRLPRLAPRNNATFGDWRLNAPAESLITESWSEGVIFGALMIMACVTVANMRKGVILHKLILTEVGCILPPNPWPTG